MRSTKWRLRALSLAGAALLAGCAADDEGLLSPVEGAGGDLLARYVALGQSNTAGLQSAGINDSTQNEAYPVILAAQAGVPFYVPSLAMPGCAPPLAGPQPLTTNRVGGGTATTCALRVSEALPYVSNVAVPASRLVDFVNNQLSDTRSNVLTSLILGGRTQLQAMRDANPTFVSVFPEGNEVLRAVSIGVPADATSQANFEAALDQVVAAIRDEGAQALLFGVPNVPMVAPALQPGAYYFVLQAAGQSPKPVSPNCAPGTVGGQSLVSFGVLSDAQVTVISCNEADFGVLSPGEIAQVTERVRLYNEAVRARAEANGWIYLDPNVPLGTLLADPNKIRKCQGLATAATPATLAQAVATTCPGPAAPNFWGSHLSFDPIHFNRLAHQVLANAMITAINQKHSLSIPTR